MNKSVSQIIKEVRKSNNLTQNQFAKKFFITEKTVSNYENGQREPSFDFLIQLCNEFNISIDYFINQKGEKSNSSDLIISERRGKFAIYDARQGLYLTPFIYDAINISKTEPHIVLKCGKDNRNAFSGKILYSATIDNNGKLTEFPDLDFSFNSIFEDGVSIAHNKKDNLDYLVNTEGKLISKGYKNICHFGGIKKNYNLYLCYDLEQDNHNILKKVNLTLIYKDGSEIPLKIISTEDKYDELMRAYTSPDLDRLEKVIKNIEKYGVNIITLADSNLFKNSKNYFDMIEKINDIFIENAKKTENYADLIENFEYLVDILLKYSKIVDNNACIKKLNEKHFERKHFFGKINNIAPKVEKLYKKIGLI